MFHTVPRLGWLRHDGVSSSSEIWVMDGFKQMAIKAISIISIMKFMPNISEICSVKLTMVA